jgi:hypothetical protein
VSKGIGPRLNDLVVAFMTAQHRIDPYFRDRFDRLFQRPSADAVQWCLRRLHSNPERSLCEEVPIDGEEEIAIAIAAQMAQFTRREYQGRTAERAGNTKTYGVVHAEFQVLDHLDSRLRQGVFAQPRRYPAWIRFGGPGPLSPPDVADHGILSIGIKLMDVDGPKLLDDEQSTQDFLGISAPTFTTPNVVENLKLQRQIFAGTPAFYFLNPFDSHYLDALMQGLYARMNPNPLEARYWSCVPFLLGAGQAMKYAVRPRAAGRTKVPWNPPDDWLRIAMQRTLRAGDATFDFLVQLQTDPRRMPIEDASIEWPESMSPFIPVATIRIPSQVFETPDRVRFARQLSFNPWHCIAEHRPLGNQNRARRHIYRALSTVRQTMNRESHVEPAGAGPARSGTDTGE